MFTVGESVELINSFIEKGNINPLADALVNHDKRNMQKSLAKQFPCSSANEISLASGLLGNAGKAAAPTRIAKEEVKRKLKEKWEAKIKLEAGFKDIRLGEEKIDVDLKGKCFWVPASVRHEMQKDKITGLARYSFFVYGGVSIQPRIHVAPGGNGPLGGNSVSSGNLNSQARLLLNRLITLKVYNNADNQQYHN